MPGYAGKILRVDLTKGEVQKELLPVSWRKMFIGGEGINDKLLWEHFKRVGFDSDPLGPDNVLIGGSGPLSGTGSGLGSKMKWTFKSPAYNMFGDSASGGSFHVYLKWAGYDHIVVTGKAKKPVYIWINDDQVEIRDASQLWGRSTYETDDLIKEELGEDIATVTIGRAGENLVRFANIINTRHRAAGRTGGGCVMGSKNLKAIAVRGTKGVEINDPENFMKKVKEIDFKMSKTAWYDAFARYGTLVVSDFYDLVGCNSQYNVQRVVTTPDLAKALDANKFGRDLKVHDVACSAGCMTGCSNWWRIKGDETPMAKRFAGEKGDKPEYVTQASFAVMCDIHDMAAVAYLQNHTNRLGIDIMECGSTTSFMMELWDRGLIDEDDVKEWFGEPIDFGWGSFDAVEKVIAAMVNQDTDFGKWASRGIWYTANKIAEVKGIPATKYAVVGKGGSPMVEDVRATPLWATLFAVSSRGCDHLKGITAIDKTGNTELSRQLFGDPGAGECYNKKLKGRAAAYFEDYTTAMANSTGICCFQVAYTALGAIVPDDVAELIYYVSGLKFTAEELLQAGERAQNIEHAFNRLLGFTRKDDTLCERWMKEPLKEGPGKGMKCEDYLKECLDEYYQTRGWDVKTALPTREKLEELSLGDVADVLEAQGKLATTGRQAERVDKKGGSG